MGYEGLRDLMAERQNRIEGMDLDASNFIIHNGSSAAMDNIAKAFINPGDVAIVEGPSFSGIVETIQSYSAEIIEVPIEEDGVSLEAVAAAIAESEAAGKTVKMIYTIPDYHNPTGVTMSAARRRTLIELCAAHRVLLVEDGRLQRTLLRQPAATLALRDVRRSRCHESGLLQQGRRYRIENWLGAGETGHYKCAVEGEIRHGHEPDLAQSDGPLCRIRPSRNTCGGNARTLRSKVQDFMRLT